MTEYRVRTPTSYVVMTRAVAGLGIAAAAAVVVIGPPGAARFAIAAVVLALAIGFAVGDSAYLIGAGRGLIRFDGDRLSVPAPRARRPLELARDRTTLVIRDVRVRVRFGPIPADTLDRGKLIELRAGAVTRKLSTLVLDDPDDTDALVADLQRWSRGEPTTGRTAPPPAPRTADDDRLDRELAQLD